MELEQIVESLIFASPDGVSNREIARVICQTAEHTKQLLISAGESEDTLAIQSDPLTDLIVKYADVTEEQIAEVVGRLIDNYRMSGRAFTLAERPTGWRIAARPEYAPWVRQLFPEKKPTKLSPGALETLAIIAYRQPVTKSSIEAVRGVSVDGPMQTLLDRNIVRIAGRADLPGRPLLYETTDLFLEHFGVKSVDELPNAAELRAVQLPDVDFDLPAEPVKEEQPELPLGEGESEAPKPAKRKKAPKAAKSQEESPAAESPAAVEPDSTEDLANAGRTLFVYEAPDDDDEPPPADEEDEAEESAAEDNDADR